MSSKAPDADFLAASIALLAMLDAFSTAFFEASSAVSPISLIVCDAALAAFSASDALVGSLPRVLSSFLLCFDISAAFSASYLSFLPPPVLAGASTI